MVVSANSRAAAIAQHSRPFEVPGLDRIREVRYSDLVLVAVSPGIRKVRSSRFIFTYFFLPLLTFRFQVAQAVLMRILFEVHEEQANIAQAYGMRLSPT